MSEEAKVSGSEIMTGYPVYAQSPALLLESVTDELDAAALTDMAEKLAAKAAQKRSDEVTADTAELTRLAAKLGATIMWPKANPARKATKKAPAESKPSVAKFVDPENTDNKWSGRGRQPAWLRRYVESGRKASEFLAL